MINLGLRNRRPTDHDQALRHRAKPPCFGVKKLREAEVLGDQFHRCLRVVAAAEPDRFAAAATQPREPRVHAEQKVLTASQIRDDHERLRHLGDAVRDRVVRAAEPD